MTVIVKFTIRSFSRFMSMGKSVMKPVKYHGVASGKTSFHGRIDHVVKSEPTPEANECPSIVAVLVLDGTK